MSSLPLFSEQVSPGLLQRLRTVFALDHLTFHFEEWLGDRLLASGKFVGARWFSELPGGGPPDSTERKLTLEYAGPSFPQIDASTKSRFWQTLAPSPLSWATNAGASLRFSPEFFAKEFEEFSKGIEALERAMGAFEVGGLLISRGAETVPLLFHFVRGKLYGLAEATVVCDLIREHEEGVAVSGRLRETFSTHASLFRLELGDASPSLGELGRHLLEIATKPLATYHPLATWEPEIGL